MGGLQGKRKGRIWKERNRKWEEIVKLDSETEKQVTKEVTPKINYSRSGRVWIVTSCSWGREKR